MAKFLIEVPHEESAQACARTIDDPPSHLIDLDHLAVRVGKVEEDSPVNVGEPLIYRLAWRLELRNCHQRTNGCLHCGSGRS